MKKALITGITGQDGSYLAEFLLEKGYEVHGITRRASLANTARIEHIMDKITLHDGDLSDSSSLIRIINIVQPDEIYNLAAQSHVQVSFDVPEYSGDVDALGVLRILEACRILGLTKKTKVYQASTSELYGKVEEVPQRETTPFHPYSPYAVAKQYGFWIVKEYREAYVCLLSTAFCSTTSPSAAARTLLPVKSHWLPEESQKVFRIIWNLETWTLCVTGVMQKIMWSACG